MPTVTINGLTNSPQYNSFVSGSPFPRYSTLYLPSARVAANGQRPLIVTVLGLWLSGANGARTVQFHVGGAWSNAIVVASTGGTGAASAYNTAGISAFFANGGATSVGLATSSGAFNFGARDMVGNTIVGQSNGANRSMVGAYDYNEVPTAPGTPSLTATVPGELGVSWAAPGDNGGSAITGYVVEYSLNASFTGASTKAVTGTSTTLTGLQPGQTYYVRVYARNLVSDTAGTYSVASASASKLVLSGAYYGVSGVWKACEVYYGLNGAWVPVSISVGNGGAWKPTTSV